MVTWACDPQNQIGHAHRIAVRAKFSYCELASTFTGHSSLTTHPLPLRTKDGALLKSYEAHTHTSTHRAHSKKQCGQVETSRRASFGRIRTYYGHHSRRERACRVSCSILLAALSAKGPGILRISLCKGS